MMLHAWKWYPACAACHISQQHHGIVVWQECPPLCNTCPGCCRETWIVMDVMDRGTLAADVTSGAFVGAGSDQGGIDAVSAMP